MIEFEILYKDKNVVVCIKPSGVSSQTDGDEKNMQDFFEEKIYCVHRLDREVSGVMVYALNQKAAAELSKQIQSGTFEKEYAAVVHGKPVGNEGIFEDILFKDSRKNKSFVVKRERKGTKKAKLSYKIISSKDELTLVEIKLYTGRTHQIRVQFASRKMPLFADRKYGGKDSGNIALFSKKIKFNNIKTGEPMEFSHSLPKEYPWDIFE